MEKVPEFISTMLIHMQKPDTTLVTGYSKWAQKFNRHVKRGEKGIRIIAPTPFKKKIEQEKLDPDTKLPLRDKDGNIIMEEKEVKIPMVNYIPSVVFFEDGVDRKAAIAYTIHIK